MPLPLNAKYNPIIILYVYVQQSLSVRSKIVQLQVIRKYTSTLYSITLIELILLLKMYEESLNSVVIIMKFKNINKNIKQTSIID